MAKAMATAKPTPMIDKPETIDASQAISRISTHNPFQARMSHTSALEIFTQG
jgi:hypothetical protein